jgi:argininosuccinate lyase
LTGLLVTLKGLPLSYNRDLQEDKEPLFDSVKQVLVVLAALAGTYQSMTFNSDVAQVAANDEFLVAIDIAEKLVEQGVPFRQAHERVGRLVGEAVAKNAPFSNIVTGEPGFAQFAELFAPGAALVRRSSPGASGPSAAAVQAARISTAREAILAKL